MNNRPYGSSGYHPSPQFRREPQRVHSPSGSKWKRRFKTALKVLVLLIILAFFFVWLLLGDFRFLLWRSWGATGFPFGNRNYLVLFQNNYELRPTGGFISTYGELKFSHGVYKGIDFFDVYGEIDDHDRVDPPLVLQALLEDENYVGHSFRDANVDPDFTLAKEELINFYHLSFPEQKVDGIIAADFTFLETLVGLYEPLTVEDYELTEDNLFETLSTAVSDIDRHNEEALANRKNITGPLVKKILVKSVAFPWHWRPTLKTAYLALEEKHLLASFERKGLEKAFSKRGWNGALPPSNAGDFLAVNEANYGGMKSDRYITRDVLYELDVGELQDRLGNPVVNATVTVTLSHEGTYNTPLSGPYTGYLRVLVPLGSNVELGGTVSEDRETALVMGDLIELLPGETKSFTYTYELPEYVWNEGNYLLHLQKQPGTLADRYRVIVRVPQGSSLNSENFEVRENVGFFDAALLTDLQLRFSLLDDDSPPHIVSHEITGLNEITIVFNERVSPEFAGNPMSYQITDLDFADSAVTDEVVVENIVVDGNIVVIRTSGMTAQAEERYEVVLREIKDLKSNFLKPNPRTVTVVQRLLGEDTNEAEGPEAEPTEAPEPESTLPESKSPETPTDNG